MPKLSPNYQLPDDPKVDIFDILYHFLDCVFTSRHVSRLFDITVHDACTRLLKLRKWGLIRVVGRSKPMTYKVTTQGREFLERRLQSKKVKTESI